MMPTKYKPEYCQQAEEYIAKGHSMEALASQFDVSRETIYNWKENIEDFKLALDKGFSKRQALVETMLMKCAYTGEGNVSALIFLSKNWAGMRDMAPGDKENPFHFDREVEPEQLARFVARHGENKAE